MSGHIVNILPHGRKIEVGSQTNLLTSLVEHSIFLRSDCGGRGVCGKCLVDVTVAEHEPEPQTACRYIVEQDIDITIPQTSMLSSHIIKKAPAALPQSFEDLFAKTSDATPVYGVAIDLGTTTIALYLCDIAKGSVLSSLSVKNPQAPFGDDVMSRIAAIAEDSSNLDRLQKLVVKTIEWGCKKLTEAQEISLDKLSKMMVVGNPAMVHIFMGVDPQPIGVAPYRPAFYQAKCVDGSQLGFEALQLSVHTLPLISGFIGADILAAAIAAELVAQPTGTLVVDIGTNGELIYKGAKGLYATSCATGPAFEGASISCGMQAIPGAIEKVTLPDRYSEPELAVIKKDNSTKTPCPTGLCGSGVISVAAELYRTGVVAASGAFIKDEAVTAFSKDPKNGMKYVISGGCETTVKNEVAISQKDIRSIQLGKGALITGIEFLLKQEQAIMPEKIIVAGAFGSYLEKEDMITLGMLPQMPLQQIINSGNLAGAGAVMALCDESYQEFAQELAAQIQVVDLASNIEFQQVFVERLGFPEVSP